jgi:unsaturated chondroitin disaccharide hydrolase
MKNYKNLIINKVDNFVNIIDDLREYRELEIGSGMYFDNDKEKYLPLSHIFNWTQSFYTGMAYWTYKITNDKKYINWCEKFYNDYYDKVFKTPLETMHDLGFLYSPYTVAMYDATREEKYKELAIQCAEALSGRFVEKGEYIRAWGRMDDKVPAYVDSELAKDHFFTESKGLVIIDCMMNLPILFWASEQSGNDKYKDIAIKHANTTMKYFIREDHSVCHAYRFNEDGTPMGVENYCGYGKESHWARGTSWAIYGFAIAYSYTGDEKYKETSLKISEKFIAELEDDGIPVWDFRLPKETPAKACNIENPSWDIIKKENTKYNRDTSASAVALCGFYEILKHTKNDKIQNITERIYNGLIKNIDDNLSIDGLLKNQNGNGSYTSFGDYFFVEAYCTRNNDIERLW